MEQDGVGGVPGGLLRPLSEHFSASPSQSGDRSAVETIGAKGVGTVIGDTSYPLARELSVEANHSGHRCPQHRHHHQQYDFQVHCGALALL